MSALDVFSIVQTLRLEIVVAIAAMTALTYLIFLQALARRLKFRQESEWLQDLELRPNCLLTRYPLCFVTPKRGTLSSFQIWRMTPGFLREHGYQVVEVPARSLNSYLQKQNSEKFHLIVNSKMNEMLRIVNPSQIVTTSIVVAPQTSLLQVIKETLFTRPTMNVNFWDHEQQTLGRVISLAERDHL